MTTTRGDKVCMSNVYYPLVEVDGKKKILFKFPQVIDHNNIFDYNKIKLDLISGNLGLSKYDSINIMFKKNKFDRFIDFMKVNCGSCPQCLKQRSLDISFRLFYESKNYENNYFITLTYDDDHIPKDFNLRKKDVSNFNKELKIYLHRKGYNSRFKFFAVGEYGSNTLRPHYHSIMLGLNIPDLKYKCFRNGYEVFTSELLQNIWGKGFVEIGSVSVASICYVARYCDKKRLLSKREKDELIESGVVPEFQLSSKLLGISFLDDYKEELLNGERKNYFINGQKFNIPFYYRKKLIESGYTFEENDNKVLSMIVDFNNIYSNSEYQDYFRYFTDLKNKLKRKRGDL